MGINYGHNLRESLNIYSGMAMGGVATVALLRYTAFRAFGNNDGVLDDVLAWTGAGLASLVPLMPTDKSLVSSLVAGASWGGWFGMHAADELREARIKREELEHELELNVKDKNIY